MGGVNRSFEREVHELGGPMRYDESWSVDRVSTLSKLKINQTDVWRKYVYNL